MPQSGPVYDGRRESFVAAALLATFLVTYLVTAGRFGFLLDEVLTVLDVRRDFVDMVTSRALVGHGPAYFALAWVWVRLFGEGELLMRLPAIFLGLSAGVVLHALLRRARWPGLAPLTLLAFWLNPVVIHLSQLARPYSLVMFLGLLSCWIMVRAEDRPTRRLLVLLAVVTGVGLNSHYSFGLVVMGQLLFALVRRRPQTRVAYALGLGCLTIVPVAVFYLGQRELGYSLSWLPEATALSFLTLPARLSGFEVRSSGLAALALSLAIILLGGWGSAALGRLGRLLLLIWLVPLLVATALGLSVFGDLGAVTRYFAVSAAAQTSLLAAAALRLFDRRPGLAVVLCAAYLAVSAWSAGVHLSTATERDFRSLVRSVESLASPWEEIVFLTPTPWPFDYYLRGSRRSRAVSVKVLDDGTIVPSDSVIRPWFSPRSRTAWIVIDFRLCVKLQQGPKEVLEAVSSQGVTVLQQTRLGKDFALQIELASLREGPAASRSQPPRVLIQ